MSKPVGANISVKYALASLIINEREQFQFN